MGLLQPPRQLHGRSYIAGPSKNKGTFGRHVHVRIAAIACLVGTAIGCGSGKGAPAAIYAALVSGILRSHAPIEPSSSEMLSAVNLSLAERRIEAQFVSIIYAIWDDENRTITVANSGLPQGCLPSS